MAFIKSMMSAGGGGGGGDVIVENFQITMKGAFYNAPSFGLPLKLLKELQIAVDDTSAPYIFVRLWDSAGTYLKTVGTTESSTTVIYSQSDIESDLLLYPDAVCSLLCDGNSRARAVTITKLILTNR